ncbi:NAD-dependent succinate-semialdehyde dehydrogenase [Saccharibacillus sp. CPCC 101409]|uniref:NAD-dependent succinate-semialdehyde dehydrogenase n=1 Tax=Saccharibacillus sp. CPCC 101409 TaxID=3058041 RepID=UPI002671D455|nr:NAD-dependent succinate-semialdehyde dehydrogenase [Saccharibacillus sp. CPCC 101409]MDO3411941.1 NAD-dependent succinate-semialdehyde dehydrogenase [Saccharibacillus sp. CPCC 101409]
MNKHGKLLIGGSWKETAEQINVVNPSNGETIGTTAKADAADAEAAVDAAYAAFPDWAALPAIERGKLLLKWHELIEAHQDELARIMTLEQGKPLKEAAGEIAYANSFIQWYAEEGKRVYGETIPASSPNKRIWVTRQPVGVAAMITPWNFPASMITRKAAPALAAGCTIVIKPSEETPFTALRLAELAVEAGIPDGVVNVVTGDPAEIAGAWQSDSRVRKLSFTGSTRVGKELMKGAADTMKKISLELGGHAPFIVTEHADLEKAVYGMISSKFRNGGQTCVCTNRVYVHESLFERFSELAAQRVSELKVGDGLEEGTEIGPLINAAAADKVLAQIEDARSKGAKVLAGGGRASEAGGGHFVQPTLVAGATDDMLCMNEETFGPLAPIASFRTIDEAVERANRSPYGLAAYVFTEHIGEAVRIAERLEFGIVGLNDPLPSTAQAPFGGFKESGLGREGGRYGIEEYLEVKYISLGL